MRVIPKPEPSLETCQALVAAGYKPHAKVWVKGRRMELISMPFPQDEEHVRKFSDRSGCGIGVMVREPGDPTTMTEWAIPVQVVRAALRQKRQRKM